MIALTANPWGFVGLGVFVALPALFGYCLMKVASDADDALLDMDATSGVDGPEDHDGVAAMRTIRAIDCTYDALGEWEHELLDADDATGMTFCVSIARDTLNALRDLTAGQP